jgi:hypothetical protein
MLNYLHRALLKSPLEVLRKRKEDQKEKEKSECNIQIKKK